MIATKSPVVVADDDELVLTMLERSLKQWGHRPVLAEDKTKLLEVLGQERPALILMDLRFGNHDGVEVMREVLARDPSLVIVLMTAYGSIDSAVAAIKLGAYDYLTKPPDLSRLQLTIDHALEKHGMSQKIQRLERLHQSHHLQRRLLGESPPMIRVREMIAQLAPTDLNVLIQGESGTGKELVATALHWQSPRRNGPLVPVNMAALPADLAESTLFGHVRGAFTGADRDHIGCCEAAHTGTLFLDEIGEMDMNLQAKLLRFLQERVIQRVGDTRPIPVDVRVVAATNADLADKVRQGKFREDLYYRLHVVPIRVPALRDRGDDLVELAEHFLEQAARRYQKSTRRFSDEAIERLKEHAWPGNVRELQNLVERVAVFATGAEIGVGDLPPEVGGEPLYGPASARFGMMNAGPLTPVALSPSGKPIPPTFEEMERQAIVDAINAADGQVSRAAAMLGIGKATLYRKIKRYQIAPRGGRTWTAEG